MCPRKPAPPRTRRTRVRRPGKPSNAGPDRPIKFAAADECRDAARAQVRAFGPLRAQEARIAFSSSLEELIGGRTLRLLLRLVGFEPRDFLIEQRDALVELLDRQQGQILP